MVDIIYGRRYISTYYVSTFETLGAIVPDNNTNTTKKERGNRKQNNRKAKQTILHRMMRKKMNDSIIDQIFPSFEQMSQMRHLVENMFFFVSELIYYTIILLIIIMLKVQLFRKGLRT